MHRLSRMNIVKLCCVSSRPIKRNHTLLIHRDSFPCTLLLPLMASLSAFGVDMIALSLPATGINLGATAGDVVLAMSAYVMSFGMTLLVCGPISDCVGRKPVVQGGCMLLVTAGVGCALSKSPSLFLLFRTLQGIGASVIGIAAVAIVRDLFNGETARAQMTNVVLAISVVPMVAPMVDVVLPAHGLRAIYVVPIAGGLVLLAAMSCFRESAMVDSSVRFDPATIVGNYRRVLRHPACVGNILCNAAAAGAVFACVTGSSLFFSNVFGPNAYGTIVGASSLSIVTGAWLNRSFCGRGASPGQLLAVGLTVSTIMGLSLLLMALVGDKSAVVVVLILVGVGSSFGLSSPHVINEAMRPMPEIAGSTSAARAFVQMGGAALSSALVVALFDGHSLLSTAVVMLAFSLLAVAAYLGVVLPANASPWSGQMQARFRRRDRDLL
ncbi:MFS transporter [Bradyrhizobium mercantei]|uniref:MFS transporter n=1 Tax=Bradyrhizobium mercantei TaxID=1904807 RepID=UPI0009765F5F|nr:MFS transporter [Bradyrhizobium mercantei]